MALAVILVNGAPVSRARAALSTSAAAKTSCTRRLLVVSAYPGEIDKLLTSANITETVVLDNRSFYVGRLRGQNVVLALTGIGLVNANKTTTNAFAHFRCGDKPAFTGVVFSGVAGSKSFIGDVIVPRRWTIDEGKTWMPVDPKMLAKARVVSRSVHLSKTDAAGDAACIGDDPHRVPAVQLPYQPQVRLGGSAKSSDPFNGREFTCVPCGGDIFGCEPCRAQRNLGADLARFTRTAPAFLDPNFILDYFKAPTPSLTALDAEDMETAAVLRVATKNHVPFIGFRGVSDGQGDPLGLPGFPFQFFVYRQISADNAATMALAFLSAWR